MTASFLVPAYLDLLGRFTLTCQLRQIFNVLMLLLRFRISGSPMFLKSSTSMPELDSLCRCSVLDQSILLSSGGRYLLLRLYNAAASCPTLHFFRDRRVLDVPALSMGATFNTQFASHV